MSRIEENILRANSIKVGDTCYVQGNKGIVEEVNRMHSDRLNADCTYIKVDFTGTYLENYGQYNHGWYGSINEAFEY